MEEYNQARQDHQVKERQVQRENIGQVKTEEQVKEERQVKKKVRTAPTNTSLLPPCKVCLEPAAGFHYGANTCEACKGFFRRSLLRQTPYKCFGAGKCNIRAGKRKICPKCRHTKCLAVGMSKEAIKTGRYTHAKRTQDILEYHQMMNTPLSDGHEAPIISPEVSGRMKLNCSSSDAAGQLNHCSEISSQTFNNCTDTTHYSAVSQSPSVAALQNCSRVPQCPSSCVSGPGQCLTPGPSPGPDSSPAPGPGPGPGLGSCPANPSACHVMLGCAFGRIDEATSPSSATASPSLVSSPQLAAQLKLGPSVLLEVERGVEGDWLEDAECERIVRQLLKSKEELDTWPCDRLTPQELLARQTACYESCKVTTETFGHREIPGEMYDDIHSKTGVDLDNRQCMMSSVAPMLDAAIHSYISFIRTIPGFRTLSTSDQINLTKNNRSEYRMIGTAYAYNWDLKVMTFVSGRTECIHELGKLCGTQHFLQRFECARDIQRLGLSREEMVVLQSVMVLTVGIDDVEEPDKVGALQWTMARCLHWLLRRSRHGDADRTFARIMAGMCRLREYGKVFHQWLQSNPCQRFLAIQRNAVLAEWFSSS